MPTVGVVPRLLRPDAVDGGETSSKIPGEYAHRLRGATEETKDCAPVLIMEVSAEAKAEEGILEAASAAPLAVAKRLANLV